MTTPAPAPADWKPEERALREKEVSHGVYAVWVQTAAVVITLMLAVSAVVAAWQAVQSVRTSAAGIQRNADENRLATAVQALGDNNSTTSRKVAGNVLLRRNVIAQMERATTGQQQRDAYDLYASTLDILEVYLKTKGTVSSEFGPGHGRPGAPEDMPIDKVYALGDVITLLSKQGRDDVQNLRQKRKPTIDLANVELYGLRLANIDFSWLGPRPFLKGIDVRATNSTGSKWNDTDVVNGYFQCATLQGADFRGADLSYADLRGADASGAHFEGAILTGAHFDGARLEGANFTSSTMDGDPRPSFSGVYGQPSGVSVRGGLSAQAYKDQGVQDECISSGKYDDRS